uniref:Uncharacterized protein n=1 Tax=Rhizophora mucronata TaxID=61149 RepID=A0A2P2QDK4_RHIMU
METRRGAFNVFLTFDNWSRKVCFT